MKKKTQAKPTPLRLDLGCGTRKRPAESFNGSSEPHPWIGVDCRKFPGVDVVCNLGKQKWPWKNESVDEIHTSHMVEHLTPPERIHFANEAFRVLKKGAKLVVITPFWCSTRAYGDLTHQWPPVAESWFYHLNAAWRKDSSPHEEGYTCDFAQPPTIGYLPAPHLNGRNPEFVQYALGNFKDAASDMIATVTKP